MRSRIAFIYSLLEVLSWQSPVLPATPHECLEWPLSTPEAPLPVILAIVRPGENCMARSFIQELKRRNVFRVAVIYLIVSWLLIQIGDVMFPALRLPEWTTTMLVAFLLLGFPIALILSWAYEATPDGIKRTSGIAPDESIADVSGQKINYIIIGVLVVAIVFLGSRELLRDEVLPPITTKLKDKSIAVLPFANRSAAEENAEFFAAGVHDELLTLLSKIGGIKVISRTSVENLPEGLSIPEIGSLLGVATVLEGQVQRAGNTLRINVQLIDAAQEDHLWATTYDRELSAGNIFQVQSEIARTIAESLHAELSENDETILDSVPTENTEALRLYMLGRQFRKESSFESSRRSASYFEQAVALDPEYAEAWAEIASVYASMLLTGLIDLEEYIAVAKPAVAQALRINNRLAEAHAQQGTLYWRSGNFDAAEESFKRALDYAPGDSNSLVAYGTYLRLRGRPQQAIPILERALVANPLSLNVLFELGKAEMYVGHPELNVKYAQRALEIDPSSVYANVAMLQAKIWMGRLDQAWPWFIKTVAADPADYESIAHLAMTAEILGEPDLADRYMDLARSIGPGEAVVLKCDALIFNMRHQSDKASEIAGQALAANLDDRWSSDLVFLRLTRDRLMQTHEFDDAIAFYRSRRPELFNEPPAIDIDNIEIAADLALLLRRAGKKEIADVLIKASLSWYRDTQIMGLYGDGIGIVYIELLALNSEKRAALDALREAVDSGWILGAQWDLPDEGFSTLRDDAEFQAIIAEIEDDMAMQLETIKALPDMGEFDLR